MKKMQFAFSRDLASGCILAVALAFGTTAVFLLIGRNTLGEAVIALLYLAPISWSTTRWGQLPGICTALTAALCFDFFFIPPFLTFEVGSLESWLLLFIFIAVAALIVGRIQYGLARAHIREREALFMYELSIELAGARTPEAIARTLAGELQQMLQADLVQVIVEPLQTSTAIKISAPASGTARAKPDQILPMLPTDKLVGEICIWRGTLPLPAANGVLLQNFAEQGALAIERALQAESELKALRNHLAKSDPALSS
jgi:K+-sensing histidine kinase KdpD